MDVIGNKETVTNFSRQAIINYKESLYKPNNAILVVAGGLRHDNLKFKIYLKIIQEKFNGWEKGRTGDFIKITKNQTKPQTLIYNKKTEQAHFCLGFQTFGITDERKYALSILATILGGGASSRLFVEVREKRGLCYYIHTSRELYQETGSIVSQAGVTKDMEKVREAIKAVYEEHKKIYKKGIKEKELRKAKEMIKGRLLLSLEDSFNVGNFFAMGQLLENKIEIPTELIKKIETITSQEVVELAKEIFQLKNLNLSVIGPFEKNLKFEII
jgi:predicted Zn-dependent peptidase